MSTRDIKRVWAGKPQYFSPIEKGKLDLVRKLLRAGANVTSSFATDGCSTTEPENMNMLGRGGAIATTIFQCD